MNNAMSQQVQVQTFTPVTVEIEGVRYLTTEQLADGYGADVDNIKKNYSNNAGRFKEGKHYIVLKGEALKELRVNMVHLQISSMTRSLYLWTKQGASRHSKMLGTDKAWDMFDELEENYFNPKQLQLTQKDKLILDIVKAKDDTSRMVALGGYTDVVVKEAVTPLIETIEVQKPKVAKYNKYLDDDGLVSPTDIKDVLGFRSAQAFNKWLESEDVMYQTKTKKKNWAFKAHFDELKKYDYVKAIPTGYGETLIRWYPKGVDWLIDLKETGVKIIPEYEEARRMMQPLW